MTVKKNYRSKFQQNDPFVRTKVPMKWNPASVPNNFWSAKEDKVKWKDFSISVLKDLLIGRLLGNIVGLLANDRVII